MTKRVALAAVGFALLIGVGWLWRTLSVPTTAPAPETAAASQEPAGEEAGRPASDVGTSHVVEERAPATTSEPKPAPVGKPELAIEGSVVVLDPAGVEHTSEDGFFSLRFEGIGDDTWKRIEVTRGRWTTRTIEGAKLRIGRIELGGRATAFESPYGSLPISPDHRYLLRARWPPSTVLHVKAADSGQELDRVELVRGMAVPMCGSSCPGPYAERDVLAASTKSPIRLDALDKVTLGVGVGSQPYYARADRYAWGRIDIDLILGGENELLLQLGGGLDVELSGPMPVNGATLCVRATADRKSEPEAQRAISQQTSFSLDSLAAGDHFVTVEAGRPDMEESLLGSAEVRIPAGSRAKVAIALRGLPTVEKVPLEGVVVLPKEWGIGEFHLRALSQGRSVPGGGVPDLQSRDMGRVEEREDEFLFGWAAVPSGRYELIVDPPCWSTIVEVGPHGLKNARVEVPPPALVSIRVVDVDLGRDAPIDELRWNPVRPEGVNGGKVLSASKSATTGRFEFSAPRGEIELEISEADYLPIRKQVTVGPGRNDFTFEIQRACGVTLDLRDGGASVPFDDSMVSIQQVGGAGRSSMNSSTAGQPGMRFAVTNPGRYRVEIHSPQGYRPIQPVVVEIEPGKFTELVVQVERLP